MLGSVKLFVMFSKEVIYDRKACIYLIKNTAV